MSYLNKLIGKTITDVLTSQGTYYAINSKETPPQVLDEIVIWFEDFSLSICNRITLSDGTSNLTSLIGKKIKLAHESDQEAKLTTSDDQWFSIDLREEAYTGPEAMCLNGPGSFFVVWN